jgi:hypothetical protein
LAKVGVYVVYKLAHLQRSRITFNYNFLIWTTSNTFSLFWLGFSNEWSLEPHKLNSLTNLLLFEFLPFSSILKLYFLFTSDKIKKSNMVKKTWNLAWNHIMVLEAWHKQITKFGKSWCICCLQIGTSPKKSYNVQLQLPNLNYFKYFFHYFDLAFRMNGH